MNKTILMGLCALLVAAETAHAQTTAFTYQGRLNDGTNVANGSYDMRFYLWDGPPPVGFPVGPTNTVAPVVVSNGLFTVALNFGSGIFTGPSRFLEIGVRTNGSVAAYTTLAPRQMLTPTPYALYAANAAQVGGQASTAFVAKAGDTMTGTLTGLGGLRLNDTNIWFRSDNNHGIGWFGTGGPNKPFAGASPDGPVLFGWAGELGTRQNNSENIALLWTTAGNVGIGTTLPEHTFDVNGNAAVRGTLLVDSHNQNDGSSDIPGIIFGDYNSFEVISSQRGTNGPNRYGLDLRTGNQPRLSIANGGNVGIGTNNPLTTLDVNGSFRINQGTVFSRVQDGIFSVGTSGGISKTVTNAFPRAFNTVPTVTATPVCEAGTDYSDVFCLTIRRVTTTNFVVNFYRVDTTGGWGQNPRVSYHAWE